MTASRRGEVKTGLPLGSTYALLSMAIDLLSRMTYGEALREEVDLDLPTKGVRVDPLKATTVMAIHSICSSKSMVQVKCQEPWRNQRSGHRNLSTLKR